MIVRPLYFLIPVVLFLSSCAEKNPPRDEIPSIKNSLALFQMALTERNMAAIDTLLAPEADENGLNYQSALDLAYNSGQDTAFHSFGGREFFFTGKRAVVTCSIKNKPSDSGRPVEIQLRKKKDRWLISGFSTK